MEKSPIILKTPPQKAINCPASGKGTLKIGQVPVAVFLEAGNNI
jgi:hypothetical protein